MSAEENKALVRKLVEAQNRQDDATVDALIAEEGAVHSWWYQPVSLDGKALPPGGITRAMMRQSREKVRAQYPHLQVSIDGLFASDDTVTVLMTTEATRRDGKTLTRKAIAVHRIADGKIAETWHQWDRLGHFQQLGVVPESAELLRQAGD